MFPRLLVVFLLVLAGAQTAAAQKRIALLIGNAGYTEKVGKLENPHNDIQLVADALKQIGFDVMSPVKDASRSDILIAVDDYATKLKQAGPDAVGFFYYSGHGIAVEGENFLVPIDAKSTSSRRMRVSGVRQEEIAKILRTTAPQAAHYIVLDACRNNIGGTRGGKGFVPVNKEAGVLYAFATKPGQTASDEGQGSGPYAKALANEIVKPGVPDLIMFHRVRTAVIASTGGDQVPWTEDGIQRVEREYFGGKTGEKFAPKQPQPPTADAASAWTIVDKSNDCDMLATFRRRYKGSIWADLAQTRSSKLSCGGRQARRTTEEPETDTNQADNTTNQNNRVPPELSAVCKRGLNTWRKRASIGAFAATQDGGCGWIWGSKTMAAAREGAMRECGKYGDGCRVIETHASNKGDWALSTECTKAKETWHKRASKGAFAVSREGACGWNWGSKTLADARKGALSECRKNGKECKVIATHSANKGDWALSTECRTGLANWRNRASKGAFAVARNGACGWNWGVETMAAARKGALKECRKRGSDCKITETHTDNEGDWSFTGACQDGLTAWRKRASIGAFAVSKNGACGWNWASNSLDEARKGALSECAKRGKECKVIETHTINKGDWTLGGNCQRDLKAWRNKSGIGAFAAARNGSCGWIFGANSMSAARKAAVDYCSQHGDECKVIETTSR